MKRARSGAAAAFAFNFAVEGEQQQQQQQKPEPPPPSAADAGEPQPAGLRAGALYARVLTATGGSAWGASVLTATRFPAGALVRLVLEDAGGCGGYVCVEGPLLGGAGAGAGAAPLLRGLVPSASLRLLPSAADRASGCWLWGDHSNPAAAQIDLTLAPPGAAARMPLVVEPGLDSLVYPLSPSEFMARHFTRRALCVHGGAARSAEVARELSGLRVPELLASASKLVAWMRAAPAAGGRMQYLDCSPEFAAAAHAAGHSLYFNPPLPLQERWLAALCSDLGMGFGARLDGGFGGDLEVFAVRGAHATPWHWDAQENFTLQLAGTKRWRLQASGVRAPLANWHPHAATAVEEDAAVLLASGVTREQLQPPPPGAPGQACVLLRPGSTLYVPSGMWHAVDAEDAEEGSLSINFSVAGCRWGDVVLRALTQHLWRRGEGLRERVAGLGQGGAGAGAGAGSALHHARVHLEGLLRELPSLIEGLRAQDVLSAKGCEEEGEGGEEEEEEEEGEGEGEEEGVELQEDEEKAVGAAAGRAAAPPALRFERASTQCVLHVSSVESLTGGGAAPPSLLLTLQSLFAGGFGASELRAQGGNRWSLQVPAALGPLCSLLEGMQVGQAVTLAAMRRAVAAERGVARGEVVKLARLLCSRGYLRAVRGEARAV